ncbi:hypothetical protein D4Z93_01545 [Clostridium fermenticellae]|uniref:Tetratricopeptide repeat protein n=1 Tax=Clostridium fermenticellae TaxID=2068654 RepID=A0A386H0Y0_9CLOT|nr:hypothetical protein [Clostridium fermenticellae]AYD39296.1 hypothetical protein D4Z93_01545 [Clostridium fermenticellae]
MKIDSGHGLFGRLSLKKKVILFCVLSLIVIGIVVKQAVYNHNLNGQSKMLNKLDDKTSSEKGRITSKNAAKTDNKDKIYEEKYNQSYKYFSDKNYTGCIKTADEIIKERPGFYKAYNIKGIAQCYSNNYTEGMNNIDESLKIKPDFGYARFNKALAYELYGYYEDALLWYDKALEVEKYVWSYYGKASIYGRRGDVKNAVKYLKIAISMSSDIKSIAAQEKDFAPIENSKEFQDLIK